MTAVVSERSLACVYHIVYGGLQTGCGFALNMMNFAWKMMNFVLTMMIYDETGMPFFLYSCYFMLNACLLMSVPVDQL